MKITKREFLSTYRLKESDFKRCKLVWSDLLEIKEDYESFRDSYDSAMKSIVDVVSRFNGVHSVRYRIKDSEHLIAKIIRKRIENKERIITIDNYKDEIKDLIGIRLLHLYKHDFLPINNQLVENYEFVEPATVNIRQGDNVEIWKELLEDPRIHEHRNGYRSVHYVIKTKPTKNTFFAEIQLRTIFEEGWSEIDHDLRYPHNIENQTLLDFLMIFNRIAGSADEMGTFIRMLTEQLQSREDELSEKESEIEELSSDLKKMIDKLKISNQEKSRLQEKISDLRQSSSDGSNSFMGHIGAADYVSKFATGSFYTMGKQKRCSHCFRPFRVSPANFAGNFSTCPHCGTNAIHSSL